MMSAIQQCTTDASIDADEDVQDFVPRWLRERLEEEENKLQSSSTKAGKQKAT